MSIIGIYKIKCIINNKVYIGSSINIYKRWSNHCYELNNNKHHSKYLQNAWSKYGKNNFIFEIIEKLETDVNIIEHEQYWMNYYKSYEFATGFNSNTKAEGNSARKWTDEQRIKFSNTRKGKKASETQIQALNKIRKIGSESNLSSLNEDIVLEIINKLNLGLIPNEVAKLCNVNLPAIKAIYSRKTWKHITGNLYIREIGQKSQRMQVAKLTEEQVKTIKVRLKNGENHLQLAKEYNVSRATLLDIKMNRIWKDIR